MTRQRRSKGSGKAVDQRREPSLSRRLRGGRRGKGLVADQPIAPKSRARKQSRGNGGSRERSRKARRPLLNWLGTIVIWAGLAVAGVLGYYALTLPDVSGIDKISKAPSITLTTESGDIVATYGDLYGETVPLEEMPAYLPLAVLATEDRHFYTHFGVNPFSMLRAAWVNLQAGEIVQGGSTITQQLAKNLFLTHERTIDRKLRELLLAFWLEAKFTKDEILSLYLDRVYLGSGTYGVEAAAQRYFGKSVRNITLQEAAMLAGLLKAPSRYAPTQNMELARERARLVLDNMVDAGYIQTKTAVTAVLTPPNLHRATTATASVRYFADWMTDEIQAYLGRHDEDLVIRTTINPRMQSIAEDVVAGMLKKKGASANAGQAALIAMDRTGAVKAMVGGSDYRTAPFNRAVSAKRQPGSAFKLFVYLAALEAGRTPDDIIVDEPVAVGSWRPSNYDPEYRGAVTVREGFARSINTIAVKLTEQAGRENVAEAAERLGIQSPIGHEPSIALGTSEVSLLELTGAYATIASGGKALVPHGLLEVRDRDGNTLYRRSGSGLGQVVDPHTAAQMHNLMAAVVEWGTGRAAKGDRPAAGKTGTSQDFRDAWFIGYTPEIVVGVWVGNDDASPMKHVTGGGLPAQIWKAYVDRVLDERPIVAFSKPAPSHSTPSQGFEALWSKILKTFGGGSPASQGSSRDGAGSPSAQRTREVAPANSTGFPGDDKR